MTKKTPKEEKPDITQDQKEALGLLAGRSARQATIEACAAAGLTVQKIAATVAGALDAKGVKVQLTMEGEWTTSPEFPDHLTRLKAVEQGIVLLDLKPTDKHEVNIIDTLSDDEINRRLTALTTKE